MIQVAILLFAVGIIALIAALVMHRTGRIHEWKMLAFLAYFVLPVIFYITTVQADLHHMESVEFCASCHVMDEHIQSLTVKDDEPLASVHYRNNYVPQEKACYTCHATYSMFGTAKTKFHGLRHVWANLTDKNVDPLHIKLYSPYTNDTCLMCHGPSEKYARAKKHRQEKDFLVRSKSGDLSCFTAGCHDLAHLLPGAIEEESDDDW